jgi:hypothetical protein
MNLGRYGSLGLALACLTLGAPQAWACGWWRCDEGRYGYRQPPRAYGYRSPPRAYRYAYAAWPSTAIPQTRAYLRSAPPIPGAGTTLAVGLTVPIASADGLRQAGVPAKGPTLFGPPAPAPGYYYSGYYYSGYYYYNGPRYSYSLPPPPTAWVEPRRRRR